MDHFSPENPSENPPVGEQVYRSAFQHMIEGYAYCKVLFDPQDRPVDFLYLEVNPAFAVQTGLRDVTGKRVTEVIPGIYAAHPELFEAYARVARGGAPERFEIDFKPWGLWFDISVCSPQRDHIITTFENITARKKAEFILRGEQEELAAIYENVPLIMLLLDMDGRIRKVNRYASEHQGFEGKGPLGAGPGDILRCIRSLDDARGCGFGPYCSTCSVQAAIRHTLTTGSTHCQIEVRLPLAVPGGIQERDFLLSAAPLAISGEPRVLVTLEDVSELNRAESELRAQLSLMRYITDNFTDSIFMTDREGRVTFMNPEAERTFGYSAEEMIGRSLHDTIHHHYPDGRPFPASECPILKTIETGEAVRDVEEVYFRKDGSFVETSGSSAIIDFPGDRRGIVYMLHDITGKKEAMRVQLRSQKLEALGSMSGGIAHDFNNILAAINGNAHFALQELDPPHSVRECLAEIAKAGSRGADLVQRILAFSRPSEQKLEPQALQPVVEEALKLARATLPAQIEISTEFAPGLPFVSVDSTQIHQVIINMVTNSAYAISDNPGHIDIRLDQAVILPDEVSPFSKLKEGPYVRLLIADDGCGIPVALLERIFDPFFTTKPVGKGTGLGLSVVQGIVTSHGGGIKVASTLGQGTAFHLYFPAVRSVAPASEPAEPRELPRHSENVLFVDDEEALVYLGVRRLESLGYHVQGFTDPELALEEFRQNPARFDVVVTDVGMPRLSGFDLAREIRSARPHFPVIVTSGILRPEDEEKAREMQLTEVLLKPVKGDELARALDRILRHSLVAAKT